MARRSFGSGFEATRAALVPAAAQRCQVSARSNEPCRRPAEPTASGDGVTQSRATDAQVLARNRASREPYAAPDRAGLYFLLAAGTGWAALAGALTAAASGGGSPILAIGDVFT